MEKLPLTPEEKRSRTMSRIRSSNTSIEVSLRRALWREGIRFRKNYKKLPGAPDIAITKYQIAIFCDGEFWHGKDWALSKPRLKTNREFWIEKIEKNMKRDKMNEWELGRLGWTVLRFWGMEIKKDLRGCVREVKKAILMHAIENFSGTL